LKEETNPGVRVGTKKGKEGGKTVVGMRGISSRRRGKRFGGKEPLRKGVATNEGVAEGGNRGGDS